MCIRDRDIRLPQGWQHDRDGLQHRACHDAAHHDGRAHHARQEPKGKDGLKAPICLNPGLDRGLAFLYAQGGSLLTADNKASAIDTAASKAAVQWYMDLFKNGLGMTASDMGAGWCGDALGKKSAAITFEGGWLDPAMSSTYPTVKYAW